MKQNVYKNLHILLFDEHICDVFSSPTSCGIQAKPNLQDLLSHRTSQYLTEPGTWPRVRSANTPLHYPPSPVLKMTLANSGPDVVVFSICMLIVCSKTVVHSCCSHFKFGMFLLHIRKLDRPTHCYRVIIYRLISWGGLII